MKLADKKAQEYIGVFKALKVGESFPVSSILPSVDASSCQAFLTERTETWWEFAIYFLAIKVGSVTAEVVEDELEFQEL